jgi:hypothetical protein
VSAFYGLNSANIALHPRFTPRTRVRARARKGPRLSIAITDSILREFVKRIPFRAERRNPFLARRCAAHATTRKNRLILKSGGERGGRGRGREENASHPALHLNVWPNSDPPKCALALAGSDPAFTPVRSFANEWDERGKEERRGCALSLSLSLSLSKDRILPSRRGGGRSR